MGGESCAADGGPDPRSDEREEERAAPEVGLVDRDPPPDRQPREEGDRARGGAAGCGEGARRLNR
jgi:hypothetical protein